MKLSANLKLYKNEASPLF